MFSLHRLGCSFAARPRALGFNQACHLLLASGILPGAAAAEAYTIAADGAAPCACSTTATRGRGALGATGADAALAGGFFAAIVRTAMFCSCCVCCGGCRCALLASRMQRGEAFWWSSGVVWLALRMLKARRCCGSGVSSCRCSRAWHTRGRHVRTVSAADMPVRTQLFWPQVLCQTGRRYQEMLQLRMAASMAVTMTLGLACLRISELMGGFCHRALCLTCCTPHVSACVAAFSLQFGSAQLLLRRIFRSPPLVAVPMLMQLLAYMDLVQLLLSFLRRRTHGSCGRYSVLISSLTPL